jgi:hypothetical protein
MATIGLQRSPFHGACRTTTSRSSPFLILACAALLACALITWTTSARDGILGVRSKGGSRRAGGVPDSLLEPQTAAPPLLPCSANQFWPGLSDAARQVAEVVRTSFLSQYDAIIEDFVSARAWRRFNIAPPSIPCEPLDRYGGRADEGWRGDGGKWLCGLERLEAPCTIFSLGSHGDFSFEELMVTRTPCVVHTFDCTVNAPSRVGTSGRIHFHKVCVGAEDRDTEIGSYRRLETIMKDVGLDSIQLLKVSRNG